MRFPPFVVGLFSTPYLSTPRAGAPLNVCALAGRLICATLLHNQQRKAQTLLGVVSPQVSYLGSSQHFLPTGRCTSVCVCPCSSKIVLFPGMMRAAGPLPRRRATLLHKFPWTLSPRPGARWVRRPVRLAPPPKEHAPQIPFRVVLHWGPRDCSWHFSMAAHCSSLPPLRSSLPPLRAQCDPALARETGRAKSYTSNTECWYFCSGSFFPPGGAFSLRKAPCSGAVGPSKPQMALRDGADTTPRGRALGALDALQPPLRVVAQRVPLHRRRGPQACTLHFFMSVLPGLQGTAVCNAPWSSSGRLGTPGCSAARLFSGALRTAHCIS